MNSKNIYLLKISGKKKNVLDSYINIPLEKNVDRLIYNLFMYAGVVLGVARVHKCFQNVVGAEVRAKFVKVVDSAS